MFNKTRQTLERWNVLTCQPANFPTCPHTHTPTHPYARTLISSLLLCVVAVMVLGRGITRGDFWWSDASRHAMDGVFIHDFVRDAPVHYWRTYAERYYAQYPALSFAFYPPLFAAVEALFFGAFGVSPFVARLTVLAFALAAVLLWHQWMHRLAGPGVAFVSAIVFITSPTIVLWTREVMLEMPALALIIAAGFFADRFVRSHQPRFLYLSVVMAGLAAWTKQTALFMVPVLIVYLTVTEKPRFWLTRPAWMAALWGAVLLAPLCAYILYFGGVAMEISVGNVNLGIPRTSLRAVTFYLSELPNALGASALLLSCIGLLLILRSSERRNWALPLTWTLVYYLFAWYLSIKQERYIFFWLPPLALFAAWGATQLTEKVRSRGLAYGLLALFCGYRVVAASMKPTPYVWGYEQAAAYVARHPKGHVALFDGYYGGCFVFHMRRYDPRKARIVLRGDKMFNPAAAFHKVGQMTLVHSPGEIRRLLDDYGVNQIVLENGPPLSPASRMLRDIMRPRRHPMPSDDFTLVKQWSLVSQNGHNVGDALLLYERKNPIKSHKTNLTILIPAFDRKIDVPLKPLSDVLDR